MTMSLQDTFGRLRMLAVVQTLSGLSDDQLLDRFLDSRDEAAFTVLIERHGPMVLAVCRRSLTSRADVEDACQATFLVLARKAGSLRKKQSLAGWIHRVVCRVVADLKRQAARRQYHEQCLQALSPADPASEETKQERLAILDEELGRLPEGYRTPLVLCYLERLTRDTAAARLGLSPGSLHGRLERGRDLLRRRLSQRGVALSAVLAGAALSEGAALPPRMVIASAKAAAIVAAGQSLTELVGPRALTLTREVLQTMVLAKLKLGTAAVLGIALLALIGGTFPSRGEAQDPNPKPMASFTKNESDEEFIRRISKDLRGTEPSPAEIHFFASTKDSSKRDKLIDLFIQERQTKKVTEAKKARELDLYQKQTALAERAFKEFAQAEKDRVELTQKQAALADRAAIELAQAERAALAQKQAALAERAAKELALADRDKATKDREMTVDQLRKELAEKQHLLDHMREQALEERARADAVAQKLREDQIRSQAQVQEALALEREARAKARAQADDREALAQEHDRRAKARAQALEALALAKSIDTAQARWFKELEALQEEFSRQLKETKNQEEITRVIQMYMERLAQLQKTQPATPKGPAKNPQGNDSSDGKKP